MSLPSNVWCHGDTSIGNYAMEEGEEILYYTTDSMEGQLIWKSLVGSALISQLDQDAPLHENKGQVEMELERKSPLTSSKKTSPRRRKNKCM
jgi:hypothetical protein